MVEAVRPNEYAGWNFTGRLAADSRIVPFLRQGGLIRFDYSEVADWNVTVDGAARNGREEAEAWWDRTRGAHSESDQPTMTGPPGGDPPTPSAGFASS